MKAKVKATGKAITVQDHGEKFHPRYWDKSQGYDAKELEFLTTAKKLSGVTPKLTTTRTPGFLTGMNWPLLRWQKATLLKVAGRLATEKEIEHLDGIIALIDAIQDHAVDQADIPEKKVFGRLR